MNLKEIPAEETLSHYLQFGFRDTRVETEKDPNISWSASVKDVEVWRLSIIFWKKKEKLNSCVTVYKNSARADRLNSLVCLCSCRKKTQQNLCFTFKLVPNLISFLSNLKSLMTWLHHFSPSHHHHCLWTLRAAKGGTGLTCSCHGNPLHLQAGCLNGSPEHLPPPLLCLFYLHFLVQ